MESPAEISRRRFVAMCATMAALGLSPAARAQPGKPAHGEQALKLYWGDLHNHNAVGYAKGSLERTFKIARGLLDFHCFTPHSQWHDMPEMDAKSRDKFLDGFKVVRERWPEVQRICREYHTPGAFVTFPGYEWHSSSYGDYCLVFPNDDAPLRIFPNLQSLQDFARKEGVLIIQHHPGNRRGNRGANFDAMRTDVSPVLEIYSEWGNAERDDAPFPYIRHSHGGVWSRNTWQHALKAGLRLGCVAGTDDHFGYPGAYREGLTAVLAPELTREAIHGALGKRHCYGVSGDRIALGFRVNGYCMGEAIPYARRREVAVDVRAWDDIEAVELVKDNEVIHRDYPLDRALPANRWDAPIVLRIEFGWGPWASLDAARICDWNLRIAIEGGKINGIQPCFQSGPYDESRFDRIHERTKNACRVQSFTSRREAFAEDDTKGIVLNLSAPADARLRIDMDAPVKMQIDRPLHDFEDGNEVFWTGSYPSESLRVKRLSFAARHMARFGITDKGGGAANWYYLRVRQANGQLAWSSPIWVEARA